MSPRVLVIPRHSLFTKVMGPLSGMAGAFVPLRLILARSFFVPRCEAEVTEEWLQILPYCFVGVCERPNHYFVYRRKGSETRLDGFTSIGVGGHIDFQEGSEDDSIFGEEVYYNSLYRELKEELGATSEDLSVSRPLTYICDHDSPVGRVHLGVVHRVLIKEDLAKRIETTKDWGDISAQFEGFQLLESIDPDFLETWSRHVWNGLRYCDNFQY